MSFDSQNISQILPFNSFCNFNTMTVSNFGVSFPNFQNMSFGADFFANFQEMCSGWMQNIVNQSLQCSANNLQTQSVFDFTPVINYTVPTYSSYSSVVSTTGNEKSSDKTKTKTKSQTQKSSQKVATKSEYATLSKKEAEKKAATDTNLECIKNGGKGWSISESNFINDIPYATKGTGIVLSKAAEMVGEELIVTSALGTECSPHNKDIADSHYDRKNTKLDFRGTRSLAKKLEATGLFQSVVFENDHIDVKIKDSVLAEAANKKSLDTLA